MVAQRSGRAKASLSRGLGFKSCRVLGFNTERNAKEERKTHHDLNPVLLDIEAFARPLHSER